MMSATSFATIGLQSSPLASELVTNTSAVSTTSIFSTLTTLHSPSPAINSTNSSSTGIESNAASTHSLNVGTIVGTTIACIVVVLGTMTCFLMKRRLQGKHSRLRESKKPQYVPSVGTAPTISSFEPKEYRGSTLHLFPIGKAESFHSARMRYTPPIPLVPPSLAWVSDKMSFKTDRLAAVRSLDGLDLGRSQNYDLPKVHGTFSHGHVSIATLSDSFSIMTGGINSVSPVEVDEWPRTASIPPTINSGSRIRRDGVFHYHDTIEPSRNPLSSKIQVQGGQVASISQRLERKPGSISKSGRTSYRQFLAPVDAVTFKTVKKGPS